MKNHWISTLLIIFLFQGLTFAQIKEKKQKGLSGEFDKNGKKDDNANKNPPSNKRPPQSFGPGNGYIA